MSVIPNESIRICVNTAVVIQQREVVLVAGQLLGGTLSRRFCARSTSKGDNWQVEEALVFGAGPPTDYDLHADGKYTFSFHPLDRMRPIEDGEEFMEYQRV